MSIMCRVHTSPFYTCKVAQKPLVSPVFGISFFWCVDDALCRPYTTQQITREALALTIFRTLEALNLDKNDL